MMHSKRKADEALAILTRLMQWSRVVDDIARSPVENIRFEGGAVVFFVDTRRCSSPPLPGFPTTAQDVDDMTVAEKRDLVAYLVRLHRERFASAARALAGNTRGGWPEVLVTGDEIEITVSPEFLARVLEVAND